MKKVTYMKLCALAIAIAMILSAMVSCESTEEDPTEIPSSEVTETPTSEVTETQNKESTEAPTTEITEASTTDTTETPVTETAETPTTEITEAPATETTETPTTESTEAPATETAETPTTETTEAPTTESTEAPTTETTEAPTTESTEAPTQETEEKPTEQSTEEVTEPEVLPEDDYSYIIYVEQKNVGENGTVVYLNGEMNEYYYATSEKIDEAITVRMESTTGGFYMYYYANSAKVYLNVVKNDTYINAVYDSVPVSVWTYDTELKTMVTVLEEKTYYFGTYGEYTTLAPVDKSVYPDNFKAVLDEPEVCKHDYLYNADGHWRIACARCDKPEGSPDSHYYYVHNVDGTKTEVDACVVCGYKEPCTDETHIITEIYADGKYSYTCSSCGKSFAEKTVPEGVTYYFSANDVVTSGFQYGNTTDRTLEVDGATPYGCIVGKDEKTSEMFWMRALVDRNNGGGQVNDGYTIDVGKAKYFVIKLRTNDVSSNLVIYFSTTSADATTTPTGEHGYKSVTFVVTNAVSEDGWVTCVADISALIPQYYVADSDGNYILDSFYLSKNTFGSTDTLDIAYMAFVDGDWSDIDALVDEDTVRYSTARTTYSVVHTNNGTAVECETCTPVEIVSGNTYKVICSVCETVMASKTIPENATCYFSANHIASGLVSYSKCDRKLDAADGEAYAHFVGTDETQIAEIYYKRSTDDKGNVGVAKADNIELGTAKYFVIKFRSNDTAKTLNGYFSTTGYNGWESVKFSVADDNGWVTYVVDLSAVIHTQFVAVDGSYVLDTFALKKEAFGPDDTVDIAYMAFAESWAEISALTGETTVRQMTDRSNFKVVNTSDGSDYVPSTDEENTEEDSENTEQGSESTEQGSENTEQGSENTEQESENTEQGGESLEPTYLFTADTIAADLVSYVKCTPGLVEDEFAYAHFVGTDETQIAEIYYKRSTDDKGNVGVAKADNIELGTAKYFVIKFRSNDTAKTLNGYFSTTGYNGWESVKFSVADDNGWVTYVVDLSAVIPTQFVAVDGSYVLDTFALKKEAFGPEDTVDIAYMAFAESWAEISALTGETTVRQMTDRSNFKVVNTSDGSDYVESSGASDSVS